MSQPESPFNPLHAEFLINIYETGAIAKGGSRSGLSPVASSRLLRKHREYFKDPLFVVSKDKLTPTPLFLSLLPGLRNFLSACSVLNARPFDIKSCKRNFRFSCNPGFSPSLIAYVLPRLMKEAPLCMIQHLSVTSNPLNLLMNGEIDLLIGRAIGLPPQAHFADLGVGRRCLLLRRNHPLADLYEKGEITEEAISRYKRVSLSSGRTEDWHSPDRGLFTGRNKDESVIFRTDRAEMAWMAMAETDIIQVSTTRSAEVATRLYPALISLPLWAKEPETPKLSLIWSDATHRDPAFIWLRKIFLEWGLQN